MNRHSKSLWAALFVAAFLIIPCVVHSAEAPEDWKRTIEAAKREGKVVVGGPPTSVLRQKFKETFEKRFGIEMELLSAPGPQNASRAMSEFKAGVKYFDVAARRLRHARAADARERPRAVHGFRHSPGNQRPPPMVGRPHVGRQHQDQSLHLLVLRGFLDSTLLQRGSRQARRSQIVRRLSKSQVEKQDRVFRAAHSQRRPGALGILDEDQGQGVFTEARQSGIIHQPRRKAARRFHVQGEPRFQPRPIAALHRALFESWNSDQTAEQHQRRV